MSKQIKLIVAAVVVIALIGIGAFLVLKGNNKPQETSSSSNQPASSETGTLKSLMAMGNVSCDVSWSSGQTSSNGKVYVTSGKMRADFTSNTEGGKQIDGHMINDGTYNYFWSSAAPQGTKTKIEASSQQEATPASGNQPQGVGVDQNVNYKCSSWSVDSAQFTPPSNVQFIDTSSMMKPPASTSAPAQSGTSSSACDSIVDPQAKAACVSATSGKY